jgi:hypothetical protein
MSEFGTHASWQIPMFRRVFSERRSILVINFGQSFLSDESWFPKVPPDFIGKIVL